ncbi:MAG: hypothetical protein K2K14_04690 [Ruminococcus sp.]|nr:hypothetical protein [Ruminococcus sp.]
MFNQNYFKGWYFKCCTKEKTIAFIPAYHQNKNNKTASLQIITDNSAFNIPFCNFQYHENPLHIQIGESIFSEKAINLNIRTKEISVQGVLKFSEISPIKYDIMGPFKFVPFMQCRHSVFSMKHQINGQITLNEQQYIFKHGIGYIEGDCGISFPKRYVWTQYHFKNGSLMLSVADIPFSGIHFTGIIGIVLLNGKEYRIATYLGAKVKYIGKNTVTVQQGNFCLTAKLLEKNAHPLYAPDNGKMSRTIHESTSCKAFYRFSYKKQILCKFVSNRASFEFEYE